MESIPVTQLVPLVKYSRIQTTNKNIRYIRKQQKHVIINLFQNVGLFIHQFLGNGGLNEAQQTALDCKLKFVRNQDEATCIKAVSMIEGNMLYVRNQTPKICFSSIRLNSYCFKYIKNKTPKMCELAVRKNGINLQYINKQTLKLCEIAVRQNPQAFRFTQFKSYNMCCIAVQCGYRGVMDITINKIREELEKMKY